MRKLVVTEFMSLDGVFQAPGPDGSGFRYEGWTFPYGNEEFMKFKTKELEESEMQLLGRVTYDSFAGSWPKHKGDWFSDKFNAMPKYVVSKTLKKAEWENSHIIAKNVVEEIKKLKKGKGGDITVHGSGQLVRFLLDNRLVDQVNILLYPVVLGTGKKLFEEAQKADLQLIEATPFTTGVVALIYQPQSKKGKSK
jgi:dihydrofolate reductase